MSEFPELDRVRVTVNAEVRERHLAAISNAIEVERRPRFRRFRLLAVAAVLVVTLPVLAFAAEESVPGDLLYPVKLMFEPVVGLVSEDVEVDHRVRELEILDSRRADPELITSQIEEARELVDESDYPEHTARIDRIEESLRERSDQPTRDFEGFEPDQTRNVPTTEPDESAGREEREVAGPSSTSTTSPARDEEKASTDSTRTSRGD